MRTRPSRTPFFVTLFVVTLALLAPAVSQAQKLDKDDKKWLEDVRPLMLSDEEATYKKLKDKNDRLEFQKIFWARRDPDLVSPQNEYQEQYQKDRAMADRTYVVPGFTGSMTDCGRVFILLGKPDEVRKEGDIPGGGLRSPETWTYRDKPGQTFQGGKAVISFDGECRVGPGVGSQLDRLASAKILHPGIDYRFDSGGHLVKLQDLLPKDTQARALLRQPRQDYPLAAQAFYLKIADGGTALVGLVRGEAAGLTTNESGGKKTVKVSVVASAESETGQEAGWAEQTMEAPIGPDGAFLGSFKLGLRPGRYKLSAGAVELKSGKGALTSLPIEVPDLSRVTTAADGSSHPVPSASSILLVREIEEVPLGSAPDPAHPFAAFALGAVRLHPFFGTTLHKSDAISIFFQVYDLTLDAAGKADALATLSLLKDGRPFARTQTTIQTVVGGSMIGPVPLESYAPGKYVVQLKVNDRVSKQDLTEETPFEVAP
jgi:GWxTD domain-containing protein